ncbi:MAG: transcription-repair coupling factor [Planctomycetota bacterium]|jgi:transcription-repair coupling factor (superfamily II helicase)
MSKLRQQLIAATREHLKAGSRISGVSGCVRSVLLATLAEDKTFHLCLTAGPESAEDIALDLHSLQPSRTVLQAPVLDDNNPDKKAAWVALLSRLHEGLPKGSIVLAPVASLIEPVPPPEIIAGTNIALVPGMEVDLGELFERLIAAGYAREDQVDAAGQFARRGGIVDIYPPTRTSPVRLELFGDDIESVRAFDLESQRSFDSLPQGVAFPLTPVEEETENAATILDYLPNHTTTLIEPEAIANRLKTLSSFHEEAGVHERIQGALAVIAEAETVLGADVGGDELDIRTPVTLGEGYQGVAGLLNAMHDAGQKCILFCGNSAEHDMATNTLASMSIKPGTDLELVEGDVEGGRVLADAGFALLSLHELLGRSRRRLSYDDTDDKDMSDMLDDFVELEKGDYVVHLQHGVARYKGIENLDREGRPGEFLTLEFADRLILHVPATNADVVQKYIGMRGAVPKLSKFNTQAWSERKIRAQKSILKLAADLLDVQAMRQKESGHACAPDNHEQFEYEASCPFRDTPDQATTSVAIKQDMTKRKPMDRLVCGDVGYGKTELAMRAAFKMVQEGRQVAVLVPTTVLAQQHFLSFSERMQNFPINVDLLSRFRTGKQQRQTIERLAEGGVDIVIGTHRLLSKDVQFKDLGLVVIDEEQRFGVEHKERLKQMRQTVDLLTLSATPIPRTLHQAMLGLRDISNLTTPPQNRLAIVTRLMHWNDRELKEAISRELARDGQIFFVHNRVFDIEQFTARVQQLVPDARVEYGHGQMPDGHLEKVMLKFMNRQIDVLVCTTIIESGIDVRSANTIIIDNAQHFGLAELHQLRGRVGRYHHQAYCYMMVPADMSLSEVASKRLKAIMQYSALGSGFKIAMRDLELRGAGNLLGPEQSGHIATIGYDLYCRLLDRTVRKLQHKDVPPDVDTQVDLGLDLRLPKKYIKSQKQRLEIYRRMARIKDNKGADDFEQEMQDRFGKPPREFQRMMMAALVRSRLSMLGITSVTSGDGHLKFRALSAPLAQRKISKGSKSFRVLDETSLALPLRKGLGNADDQLRFLSNLLQSLTRHGVFKD